MKQSSNQVMESAHFESLYPETSREKEVGEIIKYIKEGNSCQLIGLPGVGRSTILGLLTYNHHLRVRHLGENQLWFHFVFCHFSTLRKKSLLEAEKFLFLSLIESLRERKKEEEYQKLNEFFREGVPLNDELVLFQGLKKAIDYLAIEKELTIIFLFDRFEQYIPMLTSAFFANLRILRNRAKYRFSVVFSLSRPLEDLVEPELFSEFYEFLAGHTIYLSLMDKEGLDFRLAYLEKATGKKIEEDLVEKTIELTAGHGKLTRLCLETTLAFSDQRLATRSNVPAKSDLASSLELANYLLGQKPVEGALWEIWRFLTPSEQQVISKKKQEISEPSVVFLENIGLMKNKLIAIPLFEEFATRLRQDFGEASEIIIFDPNTNEIKKGDIILSDQLTALEFRLLKFLIENQGKIIEREEVINHVWQETASTAGVTDQALDQLIFRLRKKIEEDPNKPRHIETVKGRGLRFVS